MKQLIPYFFTCLCLMGATLTTASLAQETASDAASTDSQSIIQAYNDNRQAHIDALEKEELRFREAIASIEREVLETQNLISDGEETARNLRHSINSNQRSIQTIDGIVKFAFLLLFPLFGVISIIALFSSSLTYLLIVPLFINVFIYIYFKEKALMRKYKGFIITAFILGLLSIMATANAQETNRETQLNNTLVSTHEILTLSQEERFINILEAKIKNQIELPNLNTENSLLTVFSPVKINTAEYYFTLAALYNVANKSGQASDTLKKINADNAPIENPENKDIIAINSIKFLHKHSQQQAITDFINGWLSTIDQVKTYLEIYTFLSNNNMQSSADNVLKLAIEKADTVNDQLALTEFFAAKDESDNASISLNAAFELSQTAEDIERITEKAIQYEKNQVLDNIVQLYNNDLIKKETQIKLIDVFIKSGRTEDAATVLANAIKNVKRSDRNIEDTLLFYTNNAIERQMLEPAISAVTRLSVFLEDKAFNHPFNPPYKLDSKQNIPQQNQVYLPIYFGLLNEELGFTDKAESMYQITMLKSLETILQNYGYETPDTLNEYYLLGRIWRNSHKIEQLKNLDNVYTILEKKLLQKKTKQNNQSLINYQNQLTKLKIKNTAMAAQLKELADNNAELKLSKLLKLFATAIIIFILIAILIGCVYKSLHYAKSMQWNKTYAFITKFIETTGWVRVMSVFGIVSGLLSVFMGQFLQLFQRMQESISKNDDRNQTNLGHTDKTDNANNANNANNYDNRDKKGNNDNEVNETV